MINISKKEYEQLADFIKKNYGINLGLKKQALVAGRLYNVLVQNNFDNFSDYYNYITSDKTGNAVITLINKISTNHTFFMREADHFYYLRNNVFPYLFNKIRDNDFRIWSAGCSTGEEAYTIAMLIDEFLGADKKNWDTKILATDISESALKKAIEGKYGNENIASLPVNWKMSYFTRVNNEEYSVNSKIKKEVIYRKFNLMEKRFPFKRKFHVIFCRNVMIYFDNTTKDELVSRFYDALEMGGYLFIGHSEFINREKSKFKYIMPAVYRKK